MIIVFANNMQVRNSKGLSLIEVIITVALILIAGSALVQLGISALNTSDASRMRGIASQNATEALEFARSVRDNDSAGFFALNGNYVIDETGSIDDAATIFDATTCNPSSFTALSDCQISVSVGGASVDIYRVISITGAGSDKKNVTAYVFWNARGGYSNATSSTILTRWRS